MDLRTAIAVRIAIDGKVIRSCAFDQDTVRIGRDPHCDIPLPYRDISRVHCQLTREDAGGFFLTDRGSANGTKLNGRAAKYDKVETGDAIQIGDVILWIELMDSIDESVAERLIRHRNEPTIKRED